MPVPLDTLAPVVVLQRTARTITARLSTLQARIDAGDDTAWSDYCQSAATLAAIVPNLSPDRSGPLLTTAEMAWRFGVAPKTLLKHAAAGRIKPAVRRGKLYRWNGAETLAR